MASNSLVFSTGFVSLLGGTTGTGIQVPFDRTVVELYNQYTANDSTAVKDVNYLVAVLASAKRLMGSNFYKFLEDQLRYGKLDGMRILYLEDTIKAWLSLINPSLESSINFETRRYYLRDIEIDQWISNVGRNKVYSTPNHAGIIDKSLELLKRYDYLNKEKSTDEFLKVLLRHQEGLKDLVKSLFVMFGQEVIISHPTVRSAKNPSTQQLIDHLKQAV